jgi:nicotinamide mononucleotide transporter
MSWAEIIATVLTVACVLLANFRSTWQYPVGILGTIIFGYVVFQSHLIANTGLQIFFTFVQFYGWYYWVRGGINNTRPNITSIGWAATSFLIFSIILFSHLAGTVLNHFTSAAMSELDIAVFGLSVLAQFMLDRKKIENWAVWGIVNILSIWLYASSGLYVLTALYVGLLINTFIAYRMWKNAKA